ERSVVVKNTNFWQSGLPYLDSVTVIDFSDNIALQDALTTGVIHAGGAFDGPQLASLATTKGIKAIASHTGAITPFTMRVDQAPFDDVRVRQAMRLLVDRPQMIEQALSGLGSIANDLYSPFDPAYASDLPQRHQDYDQAKSLLRAAGHENLEVELVTASVAAGVVEAA